MERIGKRLLSLTLAVLLLVTLLPAQAIAAELESLAENRVQSLGLPLLSTDLPRIGKDSVLGFAWITVSCNVLP